jgi:hypothetical protein
MQKCVLGDEKLNFMALSLRILLYGCELKRFWNDFLDRLKTKLLGSECQTSGIYAKRAKHAVKTRQRRSLLVLSELPRLPSASSRSGCFHTSLGCKPKSLIWLSLGWCECLKKWEQRRSNSGLFASKRSKAPHGACWSRLSAKGASTDAPN